MSWPPWSLEAGHGRPCGCVTDPVVFGHVCQWPGTYARPVWPFGRMEVKYANSACPVYAHSRPVVSELDA